MPPILSQKNNKLIIKMIRYVDEILKMKKLEHIIQKLNYDYIYLTTTFSSATRITIEHYIIIE